MRRRRWIIAALALLLFATVGVWWGMRTAADARLRRQLVGTWEFMGGATPPPRLTFHADGAAVGTHPQSPTNWRVTGGTLILNYGPGDGTGHTVHARTREVAPDVLELYGLPAPPDGMLERLWWTVARLGRPVPKPATVRRVE